VILVAGVAVLIVVVLAGLALGLTQSRPSGGAALLAIGAGGLLVLTGGVALLAGVGLAGGGLAGGDEEDATPASAGTETSIATTRSTVAATTTAPRPSDLGAREVALHADPRDAFAGVSSVVDRLPSRTVLLVSLTGFEPGAAGVIEQCSAMGCSNSFPVTFGDEGAARLQYLIGDEVWVGPGVTASCRADDPPCVVRVSSRGAAASVITVFGGAAPPPRSVSVDQPASGIVDGATVTVTATGYMPGERVQAMLCAAPASYGTRRCGRPSAVAPFTIDADGNGRASIEIRRGRVGTEGVACGRETPCGIVVSSVRSFVPNAVVPITFAAGPSATYDTARVVAGLLLAAMLLAIAGFLVRTTDWRKPTEADTPALDRAVV
jgi:hypothetical protein